MLCGHDTWSHLKLTTLKPRVSQYISFSYENVVLSYVNEPQTIFKLVPQNCLNYLLRYCSLIYVNETICWYSALLNRFMARDELSGAILNFMTFLSFH